MWYKKASLILSWTITEQKLSIPSFIMMTKEREIVTSKIRRRIVGIVTAKKLLAHKDGTWEASVGAAREKRSRIWGNLGCRSEQKTGSLCCVRPENPARGVRRATWRQRVTRLSCHVLDPRCSLLAFALFELHSSFLPLSSLWYLI